MVKSAGPRLLVILFAVNCLVYGTGLSYTVGYPGNGADLVTVHAILPQD